MDIYKRLLMADIIDLTILSFTCVPVSIYFLVKIENAVLWGAVFSLCMTVLFMLFICRDWNNGQSLGKRILGIKLLLEDISKQKRRKIYIKRNYDIAIEMTIDLFLFRYTRRLKEINNKHRTKLIRS